MLCSSLAWVPDDNSPSSPNPSCLPSPNPAQWQGKAMTGVGMLCSPSALAPASHRLTSTPCSSAHSASGFPLKEGRISGKVYLLLPLSQVCRRCALTRQLRKCLLEMHTLFFIILAINVKLSLLPLYNKLQQGDDDTQLALLAGPRLS